MNSLSRTGGSGTSSLLGKIRQRIYAIEALQDQYIAVYGLNNTNLIDLSNFQTIYELINRFDENLLAGRQTTDVQTLLHEQVTTLQDAIIKFTETTK
ncbi:MAG: hypothetical protein GX786_10595 [Clostridiales bacterium]|nr:hypothetical protein [Clostridiales bacterium]